MSATLLQKQMENDGLQPAEQIIADSKPHRIKDLQDVHAQDSRIFYVCHGNAGYFMHHARLPEGRKWSAKRETEFTPEEKRDYAIKMQQAIQARIQEQERVHAECRERAKSIWESAKPAPADHPYLVRKGIQPHHARIHNGKLIIPVYDVDSILHGLQFIDESGSKKFLFGTATKGHFSYISGDKSKPICITEGYATAATVHEATGSTVVIAFSCGTPSQVPELSGRGLEGHSAEAKEFGWP